MENQITKTSESPQIQLHNGPKETYPVSGNVRFRALKTLDINIPQTSQGSPELKALATGNVGKEDDNGDDKGPESCEYQDERTHRRIRWWETPSGLQSNEDYRKA
jgi:hypothetical protein